MHQVALEKLLNPYSQKTKKKNCKKIIYIYIFLLEIV